MLPEARPSLTSALFFSRSFRSHSCCHFNFHFRYGSHSRSYFTSHSRSFFWGVTAACVIARLLLRSGCGLVTVFEQSSYCALFLPYLQSQSTFVRYSISNSFKSRVFMSFSLFRRFGHFIPLSLIYLRFSKTCAR